MQICTVEMTHQVYGGGLLDFLRMDSGTSQGLRKDGNALGAGCGTVKSDAFVPDILFGIDVSQACFEHDQSYATCGMDRRTADLNLGRNIIKDCELQGGGEFTCDVIAAVYATGVFIFGESAYRQAQGQSCQ